MKLSRGFKASKMLMQPLSLSNNLNMFLIRVLGVVFVLGDLPVQLNAGENCIFMRF